MNDIETTPFNPKKHIQFTTEKVNDFQTKFKATVEFDVSMTIDNRELRASSNAEQYAKENLAAHTLLSFYGQIAKDAREAYRDYQMSSNCGTMRGNAIEPTLDTSLKRFLINSMNICNPKTTSLNK